MTTRVYLNLTHSPGTKSADNRNQKEKFIDYCENKYLSNQEFNLGIKQSELTLEEKIEKQKCFDAVNLKFPPEYYFSLGLIILPFLFFSFLMIKGSLAIKRSHKSTSFHSKKQFGMIFKTFIAVILTITFWVFLVMLYNMHLNQKYSF